MLCRSLGFALLVLAVAAPTAHAAVADRVVPVRDASDGVTVGRSSSGSIELRFGPKAARLYRGIGGRRATVRCGSVTESGGRWTVDSMIGYSRVLPRKRGPVRTAAAGKLDLCAIGTSMTIDDATCLVVGRSDEGPCARVVVVLSKKGGAYMDWRSRTFEIGLVSQLDVDYPPEWAQGMELMRDAFGSDVVELSGPDAMPPVGKVGFWKRDGVAVTAAQLQDGRRKFIRREGEVVSTNLPEALTAGLGSLSLFAG